MLCLSSLLEQRWGGDEGKGVWFPRHISELQRGAWLSHTGSAYGVFSVLRAGVDCIVSLDNALAV